MSFLLLYALQWREKIHWDIGHEDLGLDTTIKSRFSETKRGPTFCFFGPSHSVKSVLMCLCLSGFFRASLLKPDSQNGFFPLLQRRRWSILNDPPPPRKKPPSMKRGSENLVGRLSRDCGEPMMGGAWKSPPPELEKGFLWHECLIKSMRPVSKLDFSGQGRICHAYGDFLGPL